MIRLIINLFIPVLIQSWGCIDPFNGTSQFLLYHAYELCLILHFCHSRKLCSKNPCRIRYKHHPHRKIRIRLSKILNGFQIVCQIFLVRQLDLLQQLSVFSYIYSMFLADTCQSVHTDLDRSPEISADKLIWHIPLKLFHIIARNHISPVPFRSRCKHSVLLHWLFFIRYNDIDQKKYKQYQNKNCPCHPL